MGWTHTDFAHHSFFCTHCRLSARTLTRALQPRHAHVRAQFLLHTLPTSCTQDTAPLAARVRPCCAPYVARPRWHVASEVIREAIRQILTSGLYQYSPPVVVRESSFRKATATFGVRNTGHFERPPIGRTPQCAQITRRAVSVQPSFDAAESRFGDQQR